MQYYPNIISCNATNDIDKDGANHLAEWAFNLNPTRPDNAALTPGTDIAGLTYTVRFANSPAGASFVSAVNAPTVTPIDANWERVIVEDDVTTGDQAIRFGRVRVSSP